MRKKTLLFFLSKSSFYVLHKKKGVVVLDQFDCDISDSASVFKLLKSVDFSLRFKKIKIILSKELYEIKKINWSFSDNENKNQKTIKETISKNIEDYEFPDNSYYQLSRPSAKLSFLISFSGKLLLSLDNFFLSKFSIISSINIVDYAIVNAVNKIQNEGSFFFIEWFKTFGILYFIEDEKIIKIDKIPYINIEDIYSDENAMMLNQFTLFFEALLMSLSDEQKRYPVILSPKTINPDMISSYFLTKFNFYVARLNVKDEDYQFNISNSYFFKGDFLDGF